jgi:ATP-binding cassette subfamily F protein uup
VGWATSYAAEALLARLYLYMEEWQTAADYASAVINDFPGNYSDYKNHLDSQEKSLSLKPKRNVDKKDKKSDLGKKKLSFKERKEFESLEKEISGLEETKASLMEKLNSGGGHHEELTLWAEEIQELSRILEEKEYRWLELAEYT